MGVLPADPKLKGKVEAQERDGYFIDYGNVFEATRQNVPKTEGAEKIKMEYREKHIKTKRRERDKKVKELAIKAEKELERKTKTEKVKKMERIEKEKRQKVEMTEKWMKLDERVAKEREKK